SEHDQRVSFLGDTHPAFHGSVVKAIASGMRTYPHIVAILNQRLPANSSADYPVFRAKMQDLLTAHVVKIQRYSPTVIEMQVRAPMAAKKFRPGHFFRVQNFETLATVVGESRLQTEATAMLGAKADPVSGHISLMVLERGVSLRLYATFRPGEPIALMGPTGVNTKIPAGGETVMIVGGRLSTASIRSIGPAMRAAGNRVLYIAGFQTADEAYCQEELEAAADVIVWVTERGAPIPARRPQDHSATGDFFEILQRYATGQLPNAIPLQEVTRVLIIGSNRLVHKMQEARHGVLRDYFTQSPEFIASIYSSMQCMLKGICAQCLQWQIDPVTKQRTKAVFACSWQDQPLDILDIANVDERLSQNRLQESLTNLWLDYLFAHHTIEKV
ncbi:MAG: pyridine nucleotide-disulfide oxidoreductase, partial [Beggiatoa sp. IS2]